MPNYGKRVDGSDKGPGFFGELQRPDGQFSTELSFGFNLGNKEYLAPLLTPNLSRAEIDHLLSGAKPTEEIYNKAMTHAVMRLKAGKDMFAQPGEQVPVPEQQYSLEDMMRNPLYRGGNF